STCIYTLSLHDALPILGWTMYGEKVVRSAAGRPVASACQFASQPSPSVETIPIPVIQASSFSASIDRLSHQTVAHDGCGEGRGRSEEHTSELQSRRDLV